MRVERREEAAIHDVMAAERLRSDAILSFVECSGAIEEAISDLETAINGPQSESERATHGR